MTKPRENQSVSIEKRLKTDVEEYTDECVKGYGRNVDDVEIAKVLRGIADSYDPDEEDS